MRANANRDGLQGRRVFAWHARHPPRAPPFTVKLCPRVLLGSVHAWTARQRVKRPLRSATMLAVRHWLGLAAGTPQKAPTRRRPVARSERWQMPPLEVRAYAQRVRGWQTGWLQPPSL